MHVAFERSSGDFEAIRVRHAAVESGRFPAALGDLLDEAADRFGSREFLNFFERGETLSFGEARRQVNRLADGLHRIGVGKGTHVAVMVPNLPAYPLTWLALARLGAVMVPVNNRYTARELAYVTTNSQADFLVIHADYFAVLEGMEPRPAGLADDRVITLGGRRPNSPHHWPDLLASGASDFTAPEPVAAGDLLNIQYTSGTTGFPKGCMQTHEYWVLAGLTASAQADFSVTRILCAQFFYYLDPQIFVALALTEGAAVYVAERPRASNFMA